MRRVRRDELRGELGVPVPVRLLAADGRVVGQKLRLAEVGVAGPGAPDPEAVLPERPPDLEAIVPLSPIRVQSACGAGNPVRAALGHEIDRHTGNRKRRVGASGGDADAVQRVEVEEDGRKTVDRNADAVVVVGVLIPVRALADERGLRCTRERLRRTRPRAGLPEPAAGSPRDPASSGSPSVPVPRTWRRSRPCGCRATAARRRP